MTDITLALDLTTRLRQHPDQVAAEFDVEEEACVADTLSFLQGMLDDGLIERAGD